MTYISVGPSPHVQLKRRRRKLSNGLLNVLQIDWTDGETASHHPPHTTYELKGNRRNKERMESKRYRRKLEESAMNLLKIDWRVEDNFISDIPNSVEDFSRETSVYRPSLRYVSNARPAFLSWKEPDITTASLIKEPAYIGQYN